MSFCKACDDGIVPHVGPTKASADNWGFGNAEQGDHESVAGEIVDVTDEPDPSWLVNLIDGFKSY